MVVLHDIAEHQGDFGAWRVWEELKQAYPLHLEMFHSHGLGIVAVGDDVPAEALALLRLQGPELAALRLLAQELGQRASDREEKLFLQRENAELKQGISAAQEHEEQLELAQQNLEADLQDAQHEHESAQQRLEALWQSSMRDSPAQRGNSTGWSRRAACVWSS